MLKAGVAVAFVLTAAAGAAGPRVEATITYDKAGYEYRNIGLTIVRGDKEFSRRVGGSYFSRPRLSVRDLDADREPEVRIDTFTGGAHCCYETQFFRYVAARATYAVSSHDWRDAGYRAKSLDGRAGVELVSSDPRFAYAFAPFAYSYFPTQIWHFERGRLYDVTRRFPGQIAVGANVLWSAYRQLLKEHGDVRGVLAAWLADQYLLGREDTGWQALQEAAERGELDNEDKLWPTGDKYLRAVRTFLVKTGYA